MEGMEEPVNEIMEIETPQGKLALNIGGTIDRMDSKGDTLRIVDYKTGGSPKTPENIEQLFTPADDVRIIFSRLSCTLPSCAASNR